MQSNQYSNTTDNLTNLQQRIERQSQLLKQYQFPLITLTLNLPVELAQKRYTEVIFNSALDAINEKINALCSPVLYRQIIHSNFGLEAYYMTQIASANVVKKAMIDIEQAHPLGALFNIDVMCQQGKTISRKSCSMAPRQCLICGQPVQKCSSTHQHTLDELEKCIVSLCNQAYSYS
ncbi:MULTISPECIES: citrate lyase holo-[acyl-carrier protein] synthase [unclassified Vibrio]|uniref:citrate lyase holo-[acyl-carrier protein] synthase n=1 Tax=unclassified Vibrio TaxID=2614977 RepID=UPI000B8E8233|nr:MULTISPECIES: citrate lyase holo-[acyl-carrier protein] synthase [unclassified Vibrio]NAW98320.1 citrate lyase holo-[acyl-carrier protein] synthase [Vibrio sp. V23_P3S9T160]OXX42253.1 citrate lyase holo-[acyl-carrier protein] synthase [Vibrio sp. V11_P1A41T118]